MVVSFATRMTGVALYGANLIVVAWAMALASGPEAYDSFKHLLGSWPGRPIMLGITFAAYFHLGGGVRHLVFDAGYGFATRTATRSALGVIVFAVVATSATWILAYAVGAL